MEVTMDAEFRSALMDAIESFGLEPLAANQVARLVQHYRMMYEWNRRVNLTRIVEPSAAARLHYAESVLAGRYAGKARTILDVGSGAGFPGIPLAVTRPESQITALEPNQKKATFLKEVKDALFLENLRIVTAPLETLDWSGYDPLVSRALDNAELIYTFILAALSPGQSLMLLCGPQLLVTLKDRIPGLVHAGSAPPQERGVSGHSDAIILETHYVPA